MVQEEWANQRDKELSDGRVNYYDGLDLKAFLVKQYIKTTISKAETSTS